METPPRKIKLVKKHNIGKKEFDGELFAKIEFEEILKKEDDIIESKIVPEIDKSVFKKIWSETDYFEKKRLILESFELASFMQLDGWRQRLSKINNDVNGIGRMDELACDFLFVSEESIAAKNNKLLEQYGRLKEDI